MPDLPAVYVAAEAMAAAVAAARAALPRELVGVLGGSGAGASWRADRFVALAAATTPTGYVVEAPAFVTAAEELATAGAAPIAFVHSHPGGAPHLSIDDVRNAWPDVPYLVLGGAFEPPHRKAFVVRNGVAQPIALRIDPAESER